MDESHITANRRPFASSRFDSRRRRFASRISNTACRFRFQIPLRSSIRSI
ncbi:hypothetical protein RchiOBHm_Chr4g0444621 [Rosa chinensis]|uniref:Uncharacterized protein n=1 Tax=Rosa chinensis TaxID=74649 RepID=A0A2P6R465_ROSCH|nr:hypothetical protein RchiOBHm_Chr4g0444621 [Rosa chinensis]